MCSTNGSFKENQGEKEDFLSTSTKEATADVILVGRKQNHENHLHQSARLTDYYDNLTKNNRKLAVTGSQGVTI